MGKAMIGVDEVAAILITIFKEADCQIKIGEEWSSLLKESGLTHEKAFYTREQRITSSGDYLVSLARIVNRDGYCLIELNQDLNFRSFNNNIDFASMAGKMTFWVATASTPFLDKLVQRVILRCLGERYEIPIGILVDLDGNSCSRSAAISLSANNIESTETSTALGQSQITSVEFSINITEHLSILSDYKVEVCVDGTLKYQQIKLTSFSYGRCQSGRSVPYINSVQNTGVINETSSMVFNLSFYKDNSDIIKQLHALAVAINDTSGVLNCPIFMRLTEFPNSLAPIENNYTLVIDEFKISVQEQSPAICQLTLKPRGKKV